jgi:hypothetical protein
MLEELDRVHISEVLRRQNSLDMLVAGLNGMIMRMKEAMDAVEDKKKFFDKV